MSLESNLGGHQCMNNTQRVMSKSTWRIGCKLQEEKNKQYRSFTLALGIFLDNEVNICNLTDHCIRRMR